MTASWVQVLSKLVNSKASDQRQFSLEPLISDLEALKAYVDFSAKALQTIIEQQKDTDWYVFISTKEFGEKTKAAALGRIVSHTAYHAGQIALAIKYGV